MHGYKERRITPVIMSRLQSNPAVALLGARQVGKSTVAQRVIQQIPDAIYLDLERPSDLNKLTDPEAFFQRFRDHMICLDEIQRTPDIFNILRSEIDHKKSNGQFLLLGSASRNLVKQSSESLAGRISYLEMTPFNSGEIPAMDGGSVFPPCLWFFI